MKFLKKNKHLLIVAALLIALVAIAAGCAGKASGVGSDGTDDYIVDIGEGDNATHEASLIIESTSLTPIVTDTLAPTDTPAPTATPAPTPEPTATPAPTPEPTPTPEPMQEVNYVPGYTNETFVNMRQEPSTTAAILRICTLGTEFYITGKSSEWFKVDLDGQTGYIFRQYVTVGTYATPKPVVTQPPMYDPNPSEFSDNDIRLVAALIHAEGPGSTYVGYRALASIVYNRIKNTSGKFPNSVPGVIFQSGQFGYSRAYLNSITPNSKAMAAAKYVFLQHGSTLPKKVLFYRAAYLGTDWTDYTRYYATIEGNCYFYGIKYF